MKEKKQYISSDGEIVSEKISEFSDAFNSEGYRFPSHKLGARIFSEVDFPEGITDVEIGRMTRLARHYMIPSSNLLGYRQGKQLRAYTLSEIGELVCKSDRQGRRFTDRMVKLRVIKKIDLIDEAQYFVNPAYFLGNGQRLNHTLFTLFKDELTPLLPDWVMMEFLRQAQPKALFGSDAVREVEGMY